MLTFFRKEFPAAVRVLENESNWVEYSSGVKKTLVTDIRNFARVLVGKESNQQVADRQIKAVLEYQIKPLWEKQIGLDGLGTESSDGKTTYITRDEFFRLLSLVSEHGLDLDVQISRTRAYISTIPTVIY